jgi:hypothetical protein
LNLAPGCTYTLTTPDNSINGLPVITTAITIEANGDTITRSSNTPFRILEIDPTGDLTLNELTISNGNANASSSISDSFIGGGIYNDMGTLTMNDSRVTGNQATNGGGIDNNTGTVTLNNSSVDHNLAPGSPDADQGGKGGGIDSFGVTTVTGVTLNHSTLDDNTATTFDGSGGIGGGVHQLGGMLTFRASTVTDNSATGDGGGLTNTVLSSAQVGVVDVHNSVFSNNMVAGPDADGGGGIFNEGTFATTKITITGNTGVGSGGFINFGVFATATLRNALLADNTSTGPGPVGAGVFNNHILTVSNGTIELNTATDPASQGGGISQDVGGSTTLVNVAVEGNASGLAPGGIYNNQGTVSLTRSPVAENRPTNCVGSPTVVPGCTG